ncbi:MAG: hypothetical protein K2O67_02420 [Clostridia bacterium]|nr:hypothetical protein [Clostridia bacterium]
MKAFTKICATVLAASSLLALSGCGKNTADARVATLANWNSRTSTTVESNYFDGWTTKKEVAYYDITVEQGTNTKYEVKYNTETAEYKTEFYMESAYDWKSPLIPESYRSTEEGADSEPVYVSKTYMHINVTFDLKDGSEPKTFEDVWSSTCKYRPAGKNLQPVYSEMSIVDTAPRTPTAGSVEDLYVRMNRVYTTYYNRDCTRATVCETDNDDAETGIKEPVEIDLSSKEGYSVFDSAELLSAARGFTLSGGSTQTFNVVSAQDKKMQLCRTSVGSPAELNHENAEQQRILKVLENTDGYIFYKPTPAEGEEKQKTLRYNAVTFSMVADLYGAAYTSWYATVENADVNATRCIMLRRATPLSFGNGTMIYTLKSIGLETI